MGRTTVAGLRWALSAALWASCPVAWAYEADQLTERERTLVDVLEPANAEMDRLLDEAVERANRATRCLADPDRTHAVLARKVAHMTARPSYAKERGFWRGFGIGVYARWIESAPGIDRIDFASRNDIYGELTFWQAPILHVAGSSSTFQVGGVRVGSDKFDHFLSLGFAYWRASRGGTDWVRAVEHGTRTEKTIYGLWSSEAFSFADLRSNWDGFRFYATLLEPGSVLTVGDDGCVERSRGFDWSEYVDERWDEVLTPSLYTKSVQRRLSETLARRAWIYCSALPLWAPEGWDAVHERYAIDGNEPWIGRTAPQPTDPFDLDDVCAAFAAEGGSSGRVDPNLTSE